MAEPERRLTDAHAVAKAAGLKAMEVAKTAENAAARAQCARVAADAAARHAAEARRNARQLERMIAATLDILDVEVGTAP